MTVKNDMDRFRLVLDVIKWVPGLADRSDKISRLMEEKRAEHRRHVVEHGEDMPEVRDWQWPY
jgi:xylulose-5-phosphate/fructose-6-phosphate phosphoketolase